jgi:hypothetical protein
LQSPPETIRALPQSSDIADFHSVHPGDQLVSRGSHKT